MNFYKIILLLFLILIIDGIWLYLLLSKHFLSMIRSIQQANTKVKLYAAIIAYVFIFLQIKLFLIDKNSSLFESFLLGLTTYGIFDFTNLAIFNKYNIKIALTDTLWGGILYALVVGIYRTI